MIVVRCLVEENAKKARRTDSKRGERCSAAAVEAAKPTFLTAEAFRDLRPLPEDAPSNGCYRTKLSSNWLFTQGLSGLFRRFTDTEGQTHQMLYKARD